MSGDIVERLRNIIMVPSEPEFWRTIGDAADEIERLRAGIDALLREIDGDHRPEWYSFEEQWSGKEPWRCELCGLFESGWPCVYRVVLDELKEARRERPCR